MTVFSARFVRRLTRPLRRHALRTTQTTPSLMLCRRSGSAFGGQLRPVGLTGTLTSCRLRAGVFPIAISIGLLAGGLLSGVPISGVYLTATSSWAYRPLAGCVDDEDLDGQPPTS